MLGFGLFASLGFALVLAPPAQPWFAAFTRGLANLSATVIRMMGGHVGVLGNTLTAPGGGFSVEIMHGCDGINVLVLLWSALLAWPAGLTAKLKGMLLGALVIEAANVIRIVALFYVGQWNAAWFEWVHLYVAEIVIMILGLAVFAAWIRQTPATANPHRAT